MISRINIRNFKCFLNSSIDFLSLTLLSGINGSGKSSLVQILLLLRQSYLQGKLVNQGLSLHGELVNLGLASDALNEVAKEDEISIEVIWDNGLNLSCIFDASKDLDYLPLKSSKNEFMKENLFDIPLFSKGFNYLGAERLGPRVVQQINDIIVKESRQVGINGEFTGHFLAKHGNEAISNDFRFHKKAASDKLISQTEAWMGELTPQTRINIKEYPGTDQVQLVYSFEIPSGTTNKYRATNVGFGLSVVLPVVVTLLAAKPGDLVIIDSPEVHLHPRAQTKIGELLARTAESGVQVIVETHSDHILNGVRLALRDGISSHEKIQFHYLSRSVREGDVIIEIHSPKIDNNGRLDVWPPGFFDEWNVNLQRLLLPKEEKNGS